MPAWRDVRQRVAAPHRLYLFQAQQPAVNPGGQRWQRRICQAIHYLRR